MRAVGNGGVYQFDQATLSLIIISTNRYKEAVTDGATKIRTIRDDIENSNIMESSVGTVVMNEIETMCKNFDKLVELQGGITATLDKYIQRHADISDYAKAQAEAAGVSEKSSKLAAKQ